MTGIGLEIDIDVERTGLHEAFFERYAGLTVDRILAVVGSGGLDWRTVAADPNCVEEGYVGWAYWLIYAKGYVQYRADGTTRPDNAYARYFVDHFLAGAHDPGLRAVVPDEAAAMARVEARYDGLRRALAGRAPVSVPVRVLASSRQRDDLHVVHDAVSGVAVKARAVDGWHRLFAAQLGGHRTVPGEVRLDERTWTWT